MKAVLATAAALVLVGCATDPMAQPNIVQRSKVLSATPKSITIQHSELGRPIAFRMADQHCAAQNKAAFYLGGVVQLGPDMTSTWRCE